jgi:hypothetical protein
MPPTQEMLSDSFVSSDTTVGGSPDGATSELRAEKLHVNATRESAWRRQLRLFMEVTSALG